MPIIRLLLITLLASWALTAGAQQGYDCDYHNVTADPADGWTLCVLQCRADFRTVDLNCTRPHTYNWCNRHCADAKADECEASGGNPINFSTAEKTHRETDYTGHGVMPLTVERAYTSAPAARSSRWGSKWTGYDSPVIHSKASTLLPTGQQSGDQYTYIDENGRRIAYQLIPNSGLQTKPFRGDVTAALIYANTNSDSIPQTWTIRHPDGREMVFEFNVQAFIDNGEYTSRLIWKDDGRGNYHYFYYDDRKRLTRVARSLGGELIYHYEGTSDWVSSVEVPGGDLYTYEHDEHGNLTAVHYPAPATESTPQPKRYHYEDARHPNHLTGISLPDGARFATYAYNAGGQAISTERADGSEKLELLSIGDEVRIRSHTGRETVYSFRNLATGRSMQRKLVSIEGEAIGTCAASDTQITHTATGQVASRTDSNGNVTQYSYNDQGLEISRTEGLKQINGEIVETAATRTIITRWAQYPTATGSVTLKSAEETPETITEFEYQDGRLVGQHVTARQ